MINFVANLLLGTLMIFAIAMAAIVVAMCCGLVFGVPHLAFLQYMK